MNKKQARAILESNARAHALKWLEAAKQAGTVYYLVRSVSKSGMSRVIELACVSNGELWHLWPNIEPSSPDQVTQEAINVLGGYSEALRAIAPSMGFNFRDRAFRIGGCGMDMVFALLDNLSGFAQQGVPYSEQVSFANDIRREPFSRK